MDEALDTWFKREVVVHDEALTRYLRRHWPHPDDIQDLRQEAYVRIYESARIHIPDEARPFIFKIARRLMADRVRRRRIVAIDSVGDLDALNVVADEISPERDVAAHQELRRLAEALDGLPPKCREVVWMRRIDGLSQKEVAARLGVTEKTVEKHLMHGMRRLIGAVFGEVEREDRKDRDNREDRGDDVEVDDGFRGKHFASKANWNSPEEGAPFSPEKSPSDREES